MWFLCAGDTFRAEVPVGRSVQVGPFAVEGGAKL